MDARNPHLRVTIHAPASADALEAVDSGLGDFNLAEPAIGDVRPLHAIAQDQSGKTIGGAIGRTWGQCCELQQFWVSKSHRRKGVGSLLMQAFECEAIARGCLLVYLDTFSFQAPSFYASRGYVEALRVTGFTGNVFKITMHKHLSPHGS